MIMMLCASAVSAQSQAGVDLAAMRGWDIVVAPEAIPSEQHAAEEFRDLFADSSGVELPIVTSTDRPDNHVFIGQSPRMNTSNVGFDTKGFGDEDLRIVIRDGNIAIAGGRPRGTLYGVYTFLEDYVGVRFLTYDHTYVPKIGKSRVIGPVDRFYHPPLEFRWSFYKENEVNPPFSVRLRINTISSDPKLGGKTGISLISHTFYHQLPVREYGQAHPEYFALVDGKRDIDAPNGDPQLCLTNPDVLGIVTAAVLRELGENPAARNVSVSQNDNERYCRCEKCAAIDEREGSSMGSLLTFVNAVADEVAKTRPDVMVGTLSYQYSRKPPRHLKPRPNVQIQLCSIECSVMHPIDDPKIDKNVTFCRDMVEWGKISRNIYIWSYNTNFGNFLLPCPNLRVIEPNIRFFVANNAKGVFMQGVYTTLSGEFSDLRNYVTSNLLWDPNRNFRQLMDEFLNLHYGRSADPIRRFINLVHDHAQASGLATGCGGQAKDFAIDESIARAGLDAFDEAMKLADSDAVRGRVEKASICAYRAAIEPVNRFDDPSQVDAELALRMRPLVKRWIELCHKYSVTDVHENGPFERRAGRISRALGL